MIATASPDSACSIEGSAISDKIVSDKNSEPFESVPLINAFAGGLDALPTPSGDTIISNNKALVFNAIVVFASPFALFFASFTMKSNKEPMSFILFFFMIDSNS